MYMHLHHYNTGLFIVPGLPLEFVGSSNSSTTITLTWKPPLLIRAIANYTLQCFTEGEKVLNISLNGSLTTTTLRLESYQTPTIPVTSQLIAVLEEEDLQQLPQ